MAARPSYAAAVMAARPSYAAAVMTACFRTPRPSPQRVLVGRDRLAAAALPREVRLDVRAGGGAELAPVGRVLHQRPQLGGERLRVARRDEPHPPAARVDLLRAGFAARSERRHRGGHRLDVGDAERLIDA